MFSLKNRYFFQKPYDVIFYYPQHFNRSENGENPYFEKLIKSCIANNLSYLLLEEPDRNTNSPRSKIATKIDFWFYTIIIFRKVVPSFCFKNKSIKELFIGKLISLLSFNACKGNTYITISNSMIDLFPGLNANANVYDLQHGIIYSWHWGYFNQEGILINFLRNDQIKFLVYGKSFKDIFFKNSENLKYKELNAVKVIGNILPESNIIKEVNFTNILYTLQITDDLTAEEIELQKASLAQFIDSIASFFIENDLRLILKNHPRFNDEFFLNSLLEKFPFVSITKKGMLDIADDIFLHLTQSSTSIFELAQKGIPTLLIINELGSKIYIDEYKYPIATFDICSQIKQYLEHNIKYKEDQRKVEAWYSNFYEPYNEEVFIKIIKNNG